LPTAADAEDGEVPEEATAATALDSNTGNDGTAAAAE